MGEPVEEQPPGLRLQSIFDEGHAIHHKWQNWLREGGWLYGKWRCEFCGGTWWDTSPRMCPDCDSEHFIHYAEVTLFDDPLMIGGHADGWIKGLGKDALIEIKSIGAGTIRMEQPNLMRDKDLNGAWRDIRRPFPTHLRQGNLYLELVRRMHEAGHIDSAPNEIVFIYELKADQSYKEFVVKADPGIVKDMLDTAHDIAHAVRTKTPLLCTVDPINGCKACNKKETE